MVRQSIRITSQPGTYALLFRCETPFQAVVGKLGPTQVGAGYWVYVGSAFGPGGLRSRLAHHLKPSTRRHWHLDYIKHALDPIEIWATNDPIRREHRWADVFAGLKGASRPIAGFGASDCSCLSHLIHMPRRPDYAIFKKQIQTEKAVNGSLLRYGLDSGIQRPFKLKGDNASAGV